MTEPPLKRAHTVDGDVHATPPADEDLYFIMNNGDERVRFVMPYTYTFHARAKQRWFDKGLLDAFAGEFRRFGRDYYENAIKTGLITVNEKAVSTDYPVKLHDVIHHTCHRHEPIVNGEEIACLGETDGIVAYYKPSGVPIHAAGEYHHNTVAGILEIYKRKLSIMHRLDYGTSGVLLLGKSKEVAAEMSDWMKQGKVAKIYLAQVDPNEHSLMHEFQFKDGEGEGTPRMKVLDAPLEVVDKSSGLSMVRDGGRPSISVICPIPESNNMVLIAPLTGRQHQIRVHMTYIGMPLIGDPLYKGTSPDIDKIKDEDEAPSTSKTKYVLRDPTGDVELDRVQMLMEALALVESESESMSKPLKPKQLQTREPITGIPDNWKLVDWCKECDELKETEIICSSERLDRVFNPMHLHALRYRGPGFNFVAPLPQWYY